MFLADNAERVSVWVIPTTKIPLRVGCLAPLEYSFSFLKGSLKANRKVQFMAFSKKIIRHALEMLMDDWKGR